jgi:type II secretory pathway component PulC
MRALQIALVIACLAVVYTAVAPIVNAAAVPAARVPPIEAPPARSPDSSEYDVIASRNLFRAKVAALAPVTEDLKESELRLKLCGTFAASTPDQSVACIDDQTAQKRRAYKVNETITDGVKLVSVERRRAVIDNRAARASSSRWKRLRARARSSPVRCPARCPRRRPRRRRRRSSPTG